MPIKHADFIIKGMHRDLSESAFSSEYSYENQNIRITTDKNDSSKHTGDLMALTNERGNKYTPVIGLESQDMQGVPIGQCMINNQWVVFYTSKTRNVEFSESAIESAVEQGDNLNLAGEESEIDNLVESSNDKIYRLWMNEDKLYGELLYEGNLGFDWKYPIETLGYYENENIQKVYWTDGLNQPRFINIVEKPEKKALWNDKSFDFVPIINLLDHKITIIEKPTGGRFPAGVIQWHFTYSKQFGQETSIFESTKLYELKFVDRGAAPDEETSQSFNITIENPDTNFDFVNIYSTIRTSLDNVPIAKCIGTIPITGNKISFTDTNLYGYAIDPQELLYKGGEIISAYTMENKDNTLFLGNYSLKRSYIPQNIRDRIKEEASNLRYGLGEESDDPYFRRSNTYRFALQFQHKSGKWSEAVYVNDKVCTISPTSKPVWAFMNLNANSNDIKQYLANLGYVRVRPLVVLPNMTERRIITQGLMQNTMCFSSDGNKLYPDYFSRFITEERIIQEGDITADNRYWYSKLCEVNINYGDRDETMRNEYSGYYDSFAEDVNVPKPNINYWSLYSPDINFNDSYQSDFNNIKILFQGYVWGITPVIQDNEITTSSISKPATGKRAWHETGRESLFYSYCDTYKKQVEGDYVTETIIEDGQEVQQTTFKSRFIAYGKNRANEYGVDYVKATSDSVEYHTSLASYPKRRPSSFDIKKVYKMHYVGGYLWEDTFMNYSTEHSEVLDADIPSRGGGFMQYYGQWIFPVMLWQASGSINYDADDKPSSVLKSNKTINYFDSDITMNGSYFCDTTDCKMAYGRNIIKLETSETPVLYTNNVDNIILWKEAYSAVLRLHPDSNRIGNSSAFTWNKNYNLRYKKRNNIMDYQDADYNHYITIDDITRTLPFDDRDFGHGSQFNWHNLPLKSYFSRSADMKYTSVPNLVFKMNHLDVRSMIRDYVPSTVKYCMPIIAISQDVDNDTIFGGKTDSALQNNNFIVAGDTVNMVDSNGKIKDLVEVCWSRGDTYRQDYEILKTYPLSFEAENCVTEVIKVKLETYWNMNCRYDTWKGNPTFATSPTNWNLMNPVYNQKDNFFVYHGLDLSTNSIDDFPNSFTWSKTKWAGDATDKWTHITLASNMDVDGSKGRITKLIKLQDNLLCFQPRGLSQILYNEREQIATGSGVPIELANSGKVSGVRYVTERTGCNNKWSICKNETGLYWVDDENKAIMAWNQQLANLSDMLGFHSWINAKSNLLVWNPIEFDSFVTYYDPFNESVMFFYKDNMLSYNTQLNCFDSFFSYGYVPYYIAFNGTAFTLSDRDSDGRDTYKVWEQHKGDYNYFYVQDQCTYDSDMNIISKGKYDIYGSPTDYGFEPYHITLLVNPDMPYDKVFTNLDMRTDMWNKNKELLEETFSHIHVWNEFQENKSTLIRNVDIPKVHLPAQHSILKKKFRVWYVDIPRDKKHPDARSYKRDRMRNTWLYMKLSKELIDDDDMITYPYISDNKHIIHHIGVSYFV